MRLRLTPEERRRLGLEGWTEVSEEFLELPPEDETVGAGIGATFASAVLLVRSFIGCPMPSLEPFGLEIGHHVEHRSWVRLTGSPETRVRAATTKAGPEAIRQDVEGDPSGIYTDLSVTSAAVDRPDGRKVVLERAGTGISLHVFARPLPPEPISATEVRAWAQSCKIPLVTELMNRNLASDSPWRIGVAAGIYARLLPMCSPVDAKTWMAEFRAGRIDPVLAAPRNWVRHLSGKQIATLRERAIAETELLHQELSEVEEQFEPESTDWQHRLLELCERRDDLEGVAMLLREAGEGELVDAAMSALDNHGDIFMDCLPAAVLGAVISDERLRCVRSFEDPPWWSGGVA